MATMAKDTDDEAPMADHRGVRIVESKVRRPALRGVAVPSAQRMASIDKLTREAAGWSGPA